MSRAIIFLLINSVIIISMGCNKDTQFGNVVVSWNIGLEPPSEEVCDRAGIKDVLVEIDSGADLLKKKEDCIKGQTVFQNVPQVTSTIFASGLNKNGCLIYFANESVDFSQVEQTVTLRLQASPQSGSIAIYWWFSDGRFCSYHEVDKIDVLVFRDDIKIIDDDVSCDRGNFLIRDAVPGRYSVRLEGRGKDTIYCKEYHDILLEACSNLELSEVLDICEE